MREAGTVSESEKGHAPPAGEAATVPAERLRRMRALRWLALPVAALLVVGAAVALVRPPFDPAWFFRGRAILEILLAAMLLLPFGRWGGAGRPGWGRWFALLLVLAVLFVFLRVIGVLFEARAVEAAGGELGLPAWSGTLIFLVLAQIPVILFLRFPDELE